MKRPIRLFGSLPQPFLSRSKFKYLPHHEQRSLVTRWLILSTGLACLVLVLFGSGLTQAEAPLTVDSFDVDQATISLTARKDIDATASSIVAGEEILGGERDLAIELMAGRINGTGMKASVNSGALSLGYDPLLTGSVRIEWDGPDGDPTSLDPNGLGGVDLTADGTQEAFLLSLRFDDNPVDLTVEVYTDEGNSSLLTPTLPGDIFDEVVDFVLPYSDFVPKLGKGADFFNVGAITLLITSDSSPDMMIDSLSTTSLLAAAETVGLLVDNDEDDQADPGDTLQYTVNISNPGRAFNTKTTGVKFSNTPDPNTTLVAGSVTTAQGSVISGNNADDADLVVDVGTIEAGTSISITFEATVNNPLPAGVTEVVSQGLVSSDSIANLLTDDPNTEAANDPTITPVFAARAISATKTDLLLVDNDQDEQADPGDTLQYTVVVTNNGDQDAVDAIFNSTLDPNTRLVVGSVVTTTQGAVTSGNGTRDTGVAVDIGTLAGAGGSVNIIYEATIDDALSADVTEVASQGAVLGGNFDEVLTDDPDTDTPNDPTITPIVSP